MRLILASGSPRRLELLQRIGVKPHEVHPPNLNETPRPREEPADYARRIAAQKAGALNAPGALILSADTVVAVGRRILGKAEDERAARDMLILLSGRRHRVHSAVTLLDGEGRARHRLSTSTVTFKRLDDQELGAYLASGEWHGKAGGYAIQGRAESLIRTLTGSHSGVMGLPLFETRTLLRAAGYPLG